MEELHELALYDLSGLSVQEIERRAADMARRHYAAAQPAPTGSAEQEKGKRGSGK